MQHLEVYFNLIFIKKVSIIPFCLYRYVLTQKQGQITSFFVLILTGSVGIFLIPLFFITKF